MGFDQGQRENDPDLPARRLAELSALADGTLDPARRAEVEARVEASDVLRSRLAEERRAVTALAALREQDRAPAQLRSRLQAEPRVRRAREGGRAFGAGRLAYGGGLATALAAVIVVVILALPGGAPGAPSVSQAAALAGRGATAPAPGRDPMSPRWLTAAVGRLHFPDWSSATGSRAIGRRTDFIRDRRVVTVYYAVSGRTVAYSIVASPVLPMPNGTVSEVRGTYVQSFHQGGRTVVTWRQAGHTCLLSATGLPEHVLAGLAARA
jgi:anti-sigma factor RsiW